MGKEKVLVVDDDDDFREMMIMYLDDCGLKIIVAKDGKEAIDLLQNKKEAVDAVLLDINMPNMDGVEVAKRLRGSEITKGLHIEFITVWNKELFKKRFPGGLDYCDGFIQKPGIEEICKLPQILREKRGKN